MKKLLLSLLLAIFTLPVAAQGLGNFFRSITGAIGGGADKSSSTGAATVGVRGQDEVDETQPGTKPTEALSATARADLKALDTWAATRMEAESSARKKGLVALKSVSYAAPPVEAAPPEYFQ